MAEKFGRLKLNGQLTGYSPLSRLIEIEGLLIGVGGKLSLWENLRAGVGERIGDAVLDELISRAQGQIAELRELRLKAAREVFADVPAGQPGG